MFGDLVFSLVDTSSYMIIISKLSIVPTDVGQILVTRIQMYQPPRYYRIKRIFSGVYLCITWTNSLTNK